jgi:hypothetical protein
MSARHRRIHTRSAIRAATLSALRRGALRPAQRSGSWETMPIHMSCGPRTPPREGGVTEVAEQEDRRGSRS